MSCRCGLGDLYDIGPDPIGYEIGFPTTGGITDTYGGTDVSGGSNTGGGILNLLSAAITGATNVARMAFQPVAHIAGPYGTSTIPVGTVTPTGLSLMGGSASLGGISPILLIGGAVLLVAMMGRGR